MTLPELIALVDSGIRLGHTATEIVERLCCEHGGEAVPSLKNSRHAWTPCAILRI